MSDQAKHYTRWLLTALFVSLSVTFAHAQVTQTTPIERKLEVDEKNWPKGVLVLVEASGLQEIDFPKGLEVKIKNISDKPIYYYHLEVLFPEAAPILRNQNGGSMYLGYGDLRLSGLSNNSQIPTPEDIPIKPGETITLKPSQDCVDRFFTFLDSETRRQMMTEGIQKIRLLSQTINFCDGTGFIADMPYPAKKKSQ